MTDARPRKGKSKAFRAGSAALIAVVVAATFFGASRLPANLYTVGASNSDVFSRLKVKAKPLTLVCPGAAFIANSKASQGTPNFTRVDSAVVDYATNFPGGVSLASQPLTGPAAGLGNPPVSQNQMAGLTTVSSVGLTMKDNAGLAEQGSATLTAQSFQLASGGGVVGALGTNCQNPSPEAWLIGGVTTVGREALLILANPNPTDATVNLQLYGSNGLIDGAGLAGISVSANRTVVLPLAGFAPNEGAITVHVTSTGASVASWLQERTIRGTVAAGADLISPTVGASTKLTIPGLLKRGTTDASALITANPDYEDLTPTIQVFVPGGQPATVTVQVIGSNAKSTGTVRQEQIPAATTAALDLPGLGDGDYTVFVVSDQPVMASVKLSRTKQGATPVTDFAWLPAVASSAASLVVTAPKSAVSKISVANAGSTAAKVEVKNRSDGSTQMLTVPPLGSVVTIAPAGGVVQVSSDQPVAATMIDDFTGQIVAIPFIDAKNVGGSIAVQVH